jgi:ornithine carbamoyltransferase
MDLKGKSFLKLLDFTPAEIDGLIDYALVLKDQKKKGIPHRLCAGKNIALVFEKTSTRTRCAFEVAAADLGMHPVYWILPVLKSARKKVSPIQLAY